jgi:hypothetical protein
MFFRWKWDRALPILRDTILSAAMAGVEKKIFFFFSSPLLFLLQFLKMRRIADDLYHHVIT